MKRLLLLFCCGVFSLVPTLKAQVTTSAMTGYIMDENNEPLPGASVIATHIPSGTMYGVLAREDGGYTLPNMRIGGPYSLAVSFIGYEKETADDIYLKLGEKYRKDVKLKVSTTELGAVTVLANENRIINSDRTGAATFITNEQLRVMPTITRSTADLTRLNPMAAEGGSFAGRNDQFNNYSLDGAIFNNPFGLDAATPGGQADAQPVSLDALDQVVVAIAPYDVAQSGFTGASVDMVTKSGTNKMTGTVFAYYRNKNMLGTKVDETEVFRGDLEQLQTGFSLGGPIVKNKIFFFLNFELERRSDLGSYYEANTPGAEGSNVSRVDSADLVHVSSVLNELYGYQTGPYQNFKHNTDNQKGILKFDFNLGENHKLTTTFNYLDASRDKPAHPAAIGRRGPDFQTLQFENSGYTINNSLFSGILELKSLFSSKFSNKLRAGFTSFEDSRDPFSTPFPVLNISKDGVRYIVAGHEPFSIHNRLDQDVIQISDNFNYYLPGHTITIGGSFEKFSFDNSFNLNAYGGTFGDVDLADFDALVNSPQFAHDVDTAQTIFDNNNANDNWALAETNMGQLAFFGQDEWTVNDQFTLTLGLRADIPLYFDTPEKIQENIDRNCCYDPSIVYSDEEGNPVTFDHTVLPKSTPLWSPRLGFNWDMNGDQTAQLRGGTGLFTGRFPFVWIGNQVANPNSYFYCMTDPEFKYPQIWRSNLGYDRKMGRGYTLTLDVIYTKDLQAAIVRNYGLRPPTESLQGPGSRPIYSASEHPTNAYVFSNTDLGNSFNASIQIRKDYANNMGWMLAYNYLDSKDAASIDAEISSDAYDRNPANVANSNTAILAPSLYGNKHRVVGSLYKKFTYGKSWATHIALYAEYTQGNRYSFTYSGDINNDGSGLNDLIYIPTSGELAQMTFSGDVAAQDAQRTAFNSYIESDDYLSEHRGQIAEKYGSVSPWFNRWDARIMQEFGLTNGNNIQLSIDILNVGNLISPKWGVRQIATSTGLAQPIGVSVAGGVPTYSFDTSQVTSVFDDFSLNSRWQAQIGLRYNF